MFGKLEIGHACQFRSTKMMWRCYHFLLGLLQSRWRRSFAPFQRSEENSISTIKSRWISFGLLLLISLSFLKHFDIPIRSQKSTGYIPKLQLKSKTNLKCFWTQDHIQSNLSPYASARKKENKPLVPPPPSWKQTPSKLTNKAHLHIYVSIYI